MGRAALDLVADYYETLAARPIVRPTTSADLRSMLDEPAPPPDCHSPICSTRSAM